VRFLRRFLTVVGAILLILVAAALVVLAWLVRDLPGPEAATAGTIPPSTFIFDRDGELLYEVTDPDGGKSVPLPLDAFPGWCLEATVATEDANFYRHFGVDPLAIARSAWLNWRSGEIVSGASTLTQQVARTLLLSPEERYERTLRRKIREAWLAVRLEWHYSKEEILALYLNHSYYGHFAYGMEAAAQSYLGKHVGELDLAECALLAGLPQWPVYYNPLENPAAAQRRQSVVLDLMVRRDALTRAEADRAGAERIQYASTPFPIEAPHFVMYVLSELEQSLSPAVLQGGGLRVHTTLDLDWQREAEAIVRRRLEQLTEMPDAPEGRKVDNAALVALEQGSGAVRAMVGSPDYFDARIDGAVNGTLILRQPGSAIKPITYSAAFDPDLAEAAGREVLTPATLVSDVRTVFLTSEGTPYVPQNYDLRFHGPVLLRQALASSFNLPAVIVLNHIGVDSLVRQAQGLGISTLDSGQEYGLALTLGGGEVQLIELTAAFSALGNEGAHLEPFAIESVEMFDGGPVPGLWGPERAMQAVSPQVAYLVTDILSDNSARLAGFGGNSKLRMSVPAAVKTGTTSDWKDNWTVGYTTDLTVGVWVGNSDNSAMLGVSGVDGAAPMWHDFVAAVSVESPPGEFDIPDGLVTIEICADSGLLPTELCQHRRSETFILGTEPREQCHMHQLFELDRRTGGLASEDTAPEQIMERVYFVLPAEMQQWARQEGFPQPPGNLGSETPAMMEEGSTSALGQSGRCAYDGSPCLVMTSPDSNAHYRLRSGLPEEAQRIEISARALDGVDVQRITLLVDGEGVLTAGEAPASAWWPLRLGRHLFQAVGLDSQGRELHSAAISITVD